jgi:transposase
MLPKGAAFLPDVSERQIRVLSRRERLRKPQLRLLAALRRKQGWTLECIAASLEQPLMTVHGWLTRLQRRGIEGLQDRKQTGRPAQLTLEQKCQLIKDLERGPPHNPSGLWTTKLVQELLRRKYNVSFVKQHVWRMLDQLGFALLRPRKQHHRRADAATIAQFKKKRDDWCASTNNAVSSSLLKTKQLSA